MRTDAWFGIYNFSSVSAAGQCCLEMPGASCFPSRDLSTGPFAHLLPAVLRVQQPLPQNSQCESSSRIWTIKSTLNLFLSRNSSLNPGNFQKRLRLRKTNGKRQSCNMLRLGREYEFLSSSVTTRAELTSMLSSRAPKMFWHTKLTKLQIPW